LPLVLIELKNPAVVNADVWKAFDQIQTYKAQIPDVFYTNELLVISDGTEALLGSLSADPERFMAWRTIDGITLDPLGEFNELQTLVRGVLAPQYLLDYLRYFVLFEDEGGIIKKIAGYHQFHAVRLAIGQAVAASRPAGSQKVGVVWHTQGSGKSITMVSFAARVSIKGCADHTLRNGLLCFPSFCNQPDKTETCYQHGIGFGFGDGSNHDIPIMHSKSVGIKVFVHSILIACVEIGNPSITAIAEFSRA
jgi:hypothetical protein